VGAGSAAFTIAVLNAVPQARATVTDLDITIDVTQSYIDNAGLTDRVEARTADLFTDELPAGFDTIFVNGVFHAWDTARRATGLAKCFQSLEPGGTLYICEHMLDDSAGQVVASVAALSLLVQTGSGDVFRTDDFAAALETAGFTDVTATPFPDQPMCSHILSGRKHSRG
jgi:SAM-dependent methyltransferase